jgi:predicted enzyme related to lactoylglutathione lyase
MLHGLATISFYAADLEAARQWYTDLLGIEAYFQMPGYIEFRIGRDEDELGIIDRLYAPAGESRTPGGAVVYWHVDDVEAALASLVSRGATEFQPVTERGHGFVTAAVIDPFDNLLGVMYNPHYVEISSRSTQE